MESEKPKNDDGMIYLTDIDEKDYEQIRKERIEHAHKTRVQEHLKKYQKNINGTF